MSELRFDATNEPIDTPPELLPPGDYPVVVIQSEVKLTSKGDGQYLWLEMDVTDGEHQGRKLWANVTLKNPNPKAEKIGKAQLSAICHAIGVLNIVDSEDLHGREFVAVVKIKPASGEYGPKNEVKGYKPKGGAGVASAGPQPVGAAVGASSSAPAAARPAAAGKAPWQK